MKFELVCGRQYRAIVALPAEVRAVLTPSMIETEMRRYQLFGRVTDFGCTYTVDAQFRGRTGSYDLPAVVQTIEEIA